MDSILSFFSLVILLIYGYAKIKKADSESSINKSYSEPTPKYKQSPPICPDQTGDNAAKCWYNSQKDSWNCRYIDENGLIKDANPKCCNNPTCEEVKKKAKKYIDLNDPEKIKNNEGYKNSNKQYFCFNKFKEKCYAKQTDLNKLSNNFCPVNTASNINSPMYKTYEECYQNNLFYKDLSKKECLKHEYYGWCTNSKGVGKCLPGTSEGPNWSSKYNCQASNIGNNSWTYGHSNPYIHVPNGDWKT
jgi:hypothetical protein